jgi:hypothetical protein
VNLLLQTLGNLASTCELAAARLRNQRAEQGQIDAMNLLADAYRNRQLEGMERDACREKYAQAESEAK